MAPNSIASAAATLRRTIKSIDVVDDLTVNVNTITPQIGLPPSLSRAVAPEGAMMPKAYIEKVGEEEFRRKPIGSGPWRFVRSVPGDRIEFEAVDYPHWRGTPHFKNLQILLVPEESTRVSMVRTGEAAIASIGPDTMLSASRGGLEVLSVPGTMQALYQFWGAYRPEFKDSPIANPRVRQALSLAIDRQADHRSGDERQGQHALSVRDLRLHRVFQRRSLEEVGEGGVSLRSRAGEEDAGRGGLSERVRSELRQHRAAGHAVHGRCRHRGRRHVDQDRRPGEADTTTNGARSRRWSGAIRRIWRAAPRCIAPSAGRTCRGATMARSPRTATSICSATRTPATRPVRTTRRSVKDLLAERDPAKRTALTDRMVELVANTWIAVPIIEGMGYYAINRRQVGQFAAIPGRHELGDVFERIPRPDEKPWKK